MYSKIVNKIQYDNELTQTFKELNTFLQKKLYTIKRSGSRTLSTTSIVNLLTMYNANTQLKSVIRDIIIETCKNTKQVGGDDKVVLEFMIHYTNELLKKQKFADFFVPMQLNNREIKKLINQHKSYPQFNELKKQLYKQSEHKVADIVLESYKLAGLTGKIFIDKKNIPEPQIELINGNVFNLHVNNQFLDNSAWDNKNVYCLIVEGIIENVHEIHNILESICEHREPLIIFATGFSDDVLSTFYSNKLRGTLNVIPIQIMQSVENINTMKDLSIVCKSEMISSLKGQSLIGLRAKDLGIIDRIVCSQNTIIIQNNNTESVQEHLKYLLGRKEETKLDDVKDLYDKRIKSLVSNYVQISVPDDVKYKEDALFENINNCIYTLKTLISRGSIKVSDVFNDDTCMFYDNTVYKSIQSLEVKTITTNTLLAILNYGIVNSNLLLSTDFAVVVDNS